MKNIRVAIVDDNKEFCEILKQYLNAENIEVVGMAYNGMDGIELIKETKPDLVVLDVVMPKVDGMDVLEEMNKDGIIKDVKAIMLSALGKETIVQKAVQLGAEYYVVKPFDFESLARRIKLIFGNAPENAPVDKKTNENTVFKSDEKRKRDEEIENQISSLMHKIGVPAHVRGYVYTRKAIKKVFDDMDLLNAVTKKLYPTLAEEFNTTSSRVERAIRNAIELAWSRGDKNIREEMFGPSNIETKPTNSHFIAAIAEKIRLENSK